VLPLLSCCLGVGACSCRHVARGAALGSSGGSGVGMRTAAFCPPAAWRFHLAMCGLFDTLPPSRQSGGSMPVFAREPGSNTRTASPHSLVTGASWAVPPLKCRIPPVVLGLKGGSPSSSSRATHKHRGISRTEVHVFSDGCLPCCPVHSFLFHASLSWIELNSPLAGIGRLQHFASEAPAAASSGLHHRWALVRAPRAHMHSDCACATARRSGEAQRADVAARHSNQIHATQIFFSCFLFSGASL